MLSSIYFTLGDLDFSAVKTWFISRLADFNLLSEHQVKQKQTNKKREIEDKHHFELLTHTCLQTHAHTQSPLCRSISEHVLQSQNY